MLTEFMALWLLQIQATLPVELKGTVVSSVSGAPMKDVLVLSMPIADAKTDSEGRFTLRQPHPWVRFSLSGYRPVTKDLQELRSNPRVELLPDPYALWNPPRCPADTRGAVMAGDTMQFTLNARAKVRRGRDHDYDTNVVCIGKFCLLHGWGPLWSFGVPTLEAFYADFVEMKERDVRWRPDVGLPGTEYRGTHADGTQTIRWHFWRDRQLHACATERRASFRQDHRQPLLAQALRIICYFAAGLRKGTRCEARPDPEGEQVQT